MRYRHLLPRSRPLEIAIKGLKTSSWSGYLEALFAKGAPEALVADGLRLGIVAGLCLDDGTPAAADTATHVGWSPKYPEAAPKQRPDPLARRTRLAEEDGQ